MASNRVHARALNFAFHSLAYTASELAGRFVQMYALLYLARACSKQEYGQVGFALAIQQLITFLAMGGIVETVTAKLNAFLARSDLPALLRAGGSLWVRSATSVALLYVVVSALFARWLLPGGNYVLLAAILVVGLLSALYIYLSTMARLEERHAAAVVLRIVSVVGGYGAAFVGAWLSTKKVEGFFVGCSIGLGAALPVALVLSTRGAGTSFRGADPALVKGLWRDSLPFLLTALFGWLSGYGNNVLIKAIFSDVEVAEYTMVCNFAFLMLLAVNSVFQIWSPRFFRVAAERSPEELVKLNALVCTGQLYLVSLVAGAVLVAYRQLLFVMKGNSSEYAGALPYLALELTGYIILGLYYRSANFYYLHDRGLQFMKLMLWTGVVGTVAWIGCMLLFGVWGIYCGFLLSMVIKGVTVFASARKQWSVEASIREFLVAAGIVCSGYAISLSLGALSGIVVYTLGAMLFAAWFLLATSKALR